MNPADIEENPIDLVPTTAGRYAGLTDRQLLEHIAATLDDGLAVLQDASTQLGPILNSPMLKMLGKGFLK